MRVPLLCLLFFKLIVCEEDPELTGDNVCIDQKEENKTVTVTYLQSEDVKEYTWCIKFPPRCPKWTTKMVTRSKLKNITRIVNHHRCCKGYEATEDKTCRAVCTDDCVHGSCVEPDTCSCDPGFSGKTCSEVGCPGGNWGPDCSKLCPCLNKGRCEANTGKCMCLPGYEGINCETQCTGGHFGESCEGTCNCTTGFKCHHITGECTPCPPGKFGLHCSEECSCSVEGGALCHHVNGNCFCKSNYYGRTCEMFCPFGYLDGICHKEPMEMGYCSCASDMYRCDKENGCVCKDGLDCEGGTHFIDFASLQAKANEGDSDANGKQAGIIVAVIVIIALLVLILVGVYYRRRMKRLKKDLENRSVRYIENSVMDKARRQNELVITNNDYVVETSEVATPPNNANNAAYNNAGFVGNNAEDANANANGAVGGACARPEKNVNIDKFKLCEDDEEFEVEDGAEGGLAKPKDVNVFLDDVVPLKKKNNDKMADVNKKINKTNVNIAINNTRDEDLDNEHNEHEERLDEEEEMDPKIYVHLSPDDEERNL